MRGVVAFLSIVVGCGGSEASSIALSLRPHQLACDVPGLQAKLQISGVGDCKLSVRVDGEAKLIEGVCRDVPAGEVRQFRLVYYVSIEGDPNDLNLATAYAEADLADLDREEYVLSFAVSDLFVDIDEDGDEVTNLEEICAHRNPRVFG
ncbi:MAG: hypothetical protein HYV07_26875 [Deltaproteobacteria bacterium]|nr:hypothetical protein [Deltaproteobacteria bacterium]